MCIVCRHNQTKDIDRALLAGATLSSSAGSTASTPRPCNAIRSTCPEKWPRPKNASTTACTRVCSANLILSWNWSSVSSGRQGGEDFKLFLQASREVTRLISLMHKMQVHLEPELIYCLMPLPVDLQDSLLPMPSRPCPPPPDPGRQPLRSCPEPEPYQTRQRPQSSIRTPTANLELLSLNPSK